MLQIVLNRKDCFLEMHVKIQVINSNKGRGIEIACQCYMAAKLALSHPHYVKTLNIVCYENTALTISLIFHTCQHSQMKLRELKRLERCGASHHRLGGLQQTTPFYLSCPFELHPFCCKEMSF